MGEISVECLSEISLAQVYNERRRSATYAEHRAERYINYSDEHVYSYQSILEHNSFWRYNTIRSEGAIIGPP
jgi:hypothetical protein